MSDDGYRRYGPEDGPNWESYQAMEDDREWHHDRRAQEGFTRCPDCGTDLGPWGAKRPKGTSIPRDVAEAYFWERIREEQLRTGRDDEEPS